MSTDDDSLYDATYEMNWDKVRALLRLKNARQLVEHLPAGYLRDDGRNALHDLAESKYPPVDVLEDMLAVSNKAPLQQDAVGRTPLHNAILNCSCWGADADMDNIDDLAYPKMRFIDVCPQAAALEDALGHTPLHMAVKFSVIAPKIIRRLFSANPSAAIATDIDGNTPLDLFFAEWDLQLRYALKSVRDDKHSIHDLSIINTQSSKIRINEVYETAILLLQAATCGTMEDSQTNFQTLHAAIVTPSCPWSYLEMILKFDPKQAHLQDEEGNFALHAAAAKSPGDGEVHECSYCDINFDKHSDSWYREKDTNDHIYCQECFLVEKEYLVKEGVEYIVMNSNDKIQSVIKDIIDANPKAARFPNHNGRLPLNIAVVNNKPFEAGGIKTIFQAAPEALSTRDIVTKMYPFMLTAVGHNEKIKRGKPSDKFLQKFSCCYALLVENPVLVSSGIIQNRNKRKHDDVVTKQR